MLSFGCLLQISQESNQVYLISVDYTVEQSPSKHNIHDQQQILQSNTHFGRFKRYSLKSIIKHGEESIKSTVTSDFLTCYEQHTGVILPHERK